MILMLFETFFWWNHIDFREVTFLVFNLYKLIIYVLVGILCSFE